MVRLIAAFFALFIGVISAQKIDLTKQVKGVLPRANAPSEVAYEDEANTFTDPINFSTSGDGPIDRGAQVYDLRSYGGVCDNSADNLSAFNAAITAVKAAGRGTIFIPAGFCRVSAAIAVDAGQIQFVGAGRGVTYVRTTSATADVFDFDGASTIGDVGVFNLTIDSSVARTAGSYVEMDNVLRGHVRDVRLDDPFQGIHIGNASAVVWVDELEVRNTVATGTSIVIDGFSVEIHLDSILMDAVTQPVAGINIVDAEGVWIKNVDLIHQGIGLLVNPGDGDLVSWVFAINSSFDSGDGEGISIDATHANGVAQGMSFTACWTSTNDSSGVIVNNSGSGTVTGIRFTAHRSFNNVGHGFLLSGGSNIFITDSSISGNSRSSVGTNHGITVATNVSDFSIIGNRSGPHAGFSNTQGWGIILLGGTTDNYIVNGNDARGNVTGGIFTDNIGVSKQSVGNLPVGEGSEFGNASHALSKLGSVANGVQVYCSDCLKGSDPCTGSSTGALAVRVNGAWQCM